MMKRTLIAFLLTCACIDLQAQVNIITTIAGKDSVGYSGDNGSATNAKLNVPAYLCLDKSGNVIISDAFNHRIRKVTLTTGLITTIAGNGVPNYNGDNIPATDAQLFVPEAISVDTFGNLYIADGGNNRIRKMIASTGTIVTVAGKGPVGIGTGDSTGDGGQATNARLNGPVGLCIDNKGNIYIGDYLNDKIRRVDAVTGIITTFAGVGMASYAGGFVGYSGDGGPATNAVLSGPIQVFADSIGNVFICDQWNHAIRKVDISTNIITTIVGTGTPGHSGDGGLAIHAQLNQPSGMDIDKQGNIFIAEYGSGTIRKIDAETGIISTVAGDDTLGFAGDGGLATNAQLRCSDVRADKYGTIYIADIDNNRIRKVYNSKLGVSNETLQSNTVRLYPNPAENLVTVSYNFGNGEDGELTILNVTGKAVLTKKLDSRKQSDEIDLNGLAPGLYLYNVTQSNMPVSKGKIIKQ